MSKRELKLSNHWETDTRNAYVIGVDNEVKARVNWQKAVQGIVEGTMTPFMVHPTKRVHSAGGTVNMPWPIIVKLEYYHYIPREKLKIIDLDSKTTSIKVRMRDGFTCGYCGGYADTVDHIKPESFCKRDRDPHNGWTWRNLIAACFSCNQKKGNHYPEDVGMKQLWTPHINGVGNFPMVQAKVREIEREGTSSESLYLPEKGILSKNKKK